MCIGIVDAADVIQFDKSFPSLYIYLAEAARIFSAPQNALVTTMQIYNTEKNWRSSKIANLSFPAFPRKKKNVAWLWKKMK